MSLRRRDFSALLLLSFLLAPASFADTGAVNALNVVEPTRAEGFGGAAAALGRDATLTWLNPAAAARLDRSVITLAGQRGQFDESAGQALVSAPLFGGSAHAGVLYYDAGLVELNAADGGVKTLRAQQDLLASLGFSAPVSGRIAAGAAVKFLRSEIFGEDASAFAADFGAQAQVNPLLKTGVSVQNLGTRLKYARDAINLPALVRVGLAAGGWLSALGLPALSKKDTVLVLADVEYPLAEQDTVFRGGVEYQTSGLVALRTGVRLGTSEGPGRFSAGLGLTSGSYRVDYSTRFGGEFSQPHTLSLTIRLGSPAD